MENVQENKKTKHICEYKYSNIFYLYCFEFECTLLIFFMTIFIYAM